MKRTGHLALIALAALLPAVSGCEAGVPGHIVESPERPTSRHGLRGAVLAAEHGSHASASVATFDAGETASSARGTTDREQEPPLEAMTLAEAYRYAVGKSERISLAQRQVVAADIRTQETRAQVSPAADLFTDGTLQREQLVGDFVLVPGQEFAAGARVRQPIFRRGYRATRDAGRQGHASAQALLAWERERLARDVAEVFIDVIRARTLLELASSAVARAEEQHEHAARRVRAGGALRTAELLSLQDLKRAERQHVDAMRELKAAEITFERLVGSAPPPKLELPPAPALPPPNEAVSRAAGRMDLVALERIADAARAEERAARERRWWPRVDVEASAQYRYPEVFDQSFEWRVTGLVTVPLLQQGRELTEVARLANEVKLVELGKAEQEKLVIEEVEFAALQLVSARQSAEFAAEQLEAAREHYELINRQFRLGAITFIEVTNAQATLVEAENAGEVARMDRVRAVYDYLFAIGALDLEALGNGDAQGARERPADSAQQVDKP